MLDCYAPFLAAPIPPSVASNILNAPAVVRVALDMPNTVPNGNVVETAQHVSVDGDTDVSADG